MSIIQCVMGALCQVYGERNQAKSQVNNINYWGKNYKITKL